MDGALGASCHCWGRQEKAFADQEVWAWAITQPAMGLLLELRSGPHYGFIIWRRFVDQNYDNAQSRYHSFVTDSGARLWNHNGPPKNCTEEGLRIEENT